MEELMTVPEIATKLRKANKTIYNYVETERIPPHLIIRFGSTIRMRVSDFEQWIESHRGV